MALFVYLSLLVVWWTGRVDAVATENATQSCLPWTNPNSTFSTTASTAGVAGLARTFHDLSKVLPHSFANCIGSVNASDLLLAIMPALKEPVCATAFVSLTTWKRDVSMAMASVSGETLTDKVFQSICAPFVDAIPCFEIVVMPKLVPLIASQPCCTSILSDVHQQFGTPLDVVVFNATRLVANVVCSSQNPGFYNQTSQTCAFTLLESFLAHARANPSILFTTTLNALQVPNDQGVAAMMGRMFKGTDNMTKPALFTAPFLPGSCIRPFHDLLTWMRNLPLLRAPAFGLQLSQLFEDDKCMPGQLLMSFFTTGDSPAIQGLKAMVRNNSSCFHLANGYPTDAFDVPALTLFTSTLHEIHSLDIIAPPESTQPSTPSPALKQESNAAPPLMPSCLAMVAAFAICRRWFCM